MPVTTGTISPDHTRMTSNANSKTSWPTDELADTRHVGTVARLVATHQRTGAAWITGGSLWSAAGLFYTAGGWKFRTSSATFLAADVFLGAGIIGLLTLRLHGSSRPATAALIMALIGRVVFALAEISGLITGAENTVLLPIGGLLTGVSAIAYGALARQADRRLRAASVAMGLYFAVVMMPFAVTTGEPPALILAAWGLSAVLIGGTLKRNRTPPDNYDELSQSGDVPIINAATTEPDSASQ
jgi:hypothetical protein